MLPLLIFSNFFFIIAIILKMMKKIAGLIETLGRRIKGGGTTSEAAEEGKQENEI